MAFDREFESPEQGGQSYFSEHTESELGYDGVLPEEDGAEDLDDAIDPDGDAEPTLRPGAVEHYEPFDEEWSEDRNSEYGDPHRPELSYVPSGEMAIARRAETGPSPVLEGSSQGCRIVTAWNGATGEGGLIHVGAEDMGSQIGQGLIDEVIERAPSLRGPNVTTFVFGDAETLPADMQEAGGEWNFALAEHLRSRGLDPEVLSGGDGKNVYLDTATGRVDVYDTHGDLIFTHTPETATDITSPSDEQVAASQEATDRDAMPMPDEAGAADANEPTPVYATSLRQAIATIAPSAGTMRFAHGNARDVEDLYNSAMARRDAPTDPRERARILSNLAGDGRDGLNTINQLIEENRYILDDLRGPDGDDTAIREVVSGKIESVIADYTVRIDRLAGTDNEELIAQRESLERRRAEMEQVRQNLTQRNT